MSVQDCDPTTTVHPIERPPKYKSSSRNSSLHHPTPKYHHVFTIPHQSCPPSSPPNDSIPSTIHNKYPRHGRWRHWSSSKDRRPRVRLQAPQLLRSSSLMINCLHRDAFQKREKANEDYAIKQREKEKLLELKKKLADQQQHLKKLEESM